MEPGKEGTGRQYFFSNLQIVKSFTIESSVHKSDNEEEVDFTPEALIWFGGLFASTCIQIPEKQIPRIRFKKCNSIANVPNLKKRQLFKTAEGADLSTLQ